MEHASLVQDNTARGQIKSVSVKIAKHVSLASINQIPVARQAGLFFF